MAPFPSPIERTVASALLLLSLSPPKSGFDGELMLKEGSEEEESQSLSLVSSGGSKSKSKTKSRSSSCSVVTSDASSHEIRAHKLRIIAVVARCHEMKLKVVKKRRSKVCLSSDHVKISAAKPAKEASGSVSAEASCVSTSSSAVSTARSGKRRGVAREEPRRKRVGSNGSRYGSAHLSRRADSILKFLSGGCSSELHIRQAIGDSPDTSKALRMLLKLEEVKRSGTGGRPDPYIYMIV